MHLLPKLNDASPVINVLDIHSMQPPNAGNTSLYCLMISVLLFILHCKCALWQSLQENRILNYGRELSTHQMMARPVMLSFYRQLPYYVHSNFKILVYLSYHRYQTQHSRIEIMKYKLNNKVETDFLLPMLSEMCRQFSNIMKDTNQNKQINQYKYNHTILK